MPDHDEEGSKANQALQVGKTVKHTDKNEKNRSKHPQSAKKQASQHKKAKKAKREQH